MTENEQDLIDEYEELDQKIKELDNKKKSIKESIADILHSESVNKKIFESSSNTKWKAEYQTRNSRKTNYQLLMEIAGPDKYHDVVSENQSTSLVIAKAPKSEQSKTKEKPIEDSVPSTPKGVIS